ncbi:hypothetical protein HS1genome_1291 [Sulfodiicoccus acidiphilus]|uniref:Uncharacterized protein n=1 Tax=Sulfodiicoccus acidiphilus TaxID=1670455 RepID=A0A348B400_9CREN|nr:hypothetical protein HS1genome_1291 [Sulfodiicoccus acidiphilus]
MRVGNLGVRKPRTIVFSQEMELPAFVAARAAATAGYRLLVLELFEFLFSVLPYVEVDGPILILLRGDDPEVKGSMNAMREDHEILSCTKELGGLCDVSLSLSLTQLFLSGQDGYRAKRLLEEVQHLEDLDSWGESKVATIPAPSAVVLSPVLRPARRTVARYSGLETLEMGDLPPRGSVLIYTGVDSHLAKKELSLRGQYYYPLLLDVDPILAPVYAAIVALKLPKLNKR